MEQWLVEEGADRFNILFSEAGGGRQQVGPRLITEGSDGRIQGCQI